MPKPAILRIERGRIADDETGKPAVFGAVLSGDPREIHRNLYDGDDGRFASGVWQCTPGVVAMTDWPYEEFCVLLSGRVVITPQGGIPEEYKTGDALILPMGFTGTWDIKETVRKYYAVQKRQTALVRVKLRLRGWLGALGIGGRKGVAEAAF